MVKEIKFGRISRTANVRMLNDMHDVLYDKKQMSIKKNPELYYMYRDLYKDDYDFETIKKHNLRYDITVIPPKMVGREYVKTAGHCHPKVPDTDVSYPEVYQVLEGYATYLLQKMEGGKVEDVVVINAQAGDYVVIPPDYCHITINTSDETLKMANWVCREFSSLYDSIKQRSGGAYYLIDTGFIKNPEYYEVPQIRYLSPLEYPKFGLNKGQDMYNLITGIGKLKFLTSPQEYMDDFDYIIGK
ncbi:glucose-6-phosphate isomerase family protein [Methanohalobium sp.]|uniref:glucose-6-phosphate isomerase family protein n=1 Tax=Methanohalobium sp. TaxID=2837493 RepID=UPI0025FEB42D|nr:glucose-6-phosphate isomerase family protein [Methanohalobium sp.]